MAAITCFESKTVWKRATPRSSTTHTALACIDLTPRAQEEETRGGVKERPRDKPNVFVLLLIAFALFAAAVITIGGRA